MAEPSGLFRKKSLERLSSPERLDQLMQLVDRRSWIPLTAVGALLVLGLSWSIAGRIPMTVQGRGVLIQPRRVVDLDAPGSGKLERFHVAAGEPVRQGQLLATIARPELDAQLQALRHKQAQLDVRARAARLLRGGDGSTGRDRLTQRGLADALRAESLDAIADTRTRLREQWVLATELADKLGERVVSQRRLHDEGILSRQDLIDAEESHMTSLRRVSDLEADLAELRTRELVVEGDYLARLQGLAESDTDEEREEIDVAREIARVEAVLARESRIVSDHDGVVLELTAPVGDVLSPGERVGSLAVADDDRPLTCVVYFSVRDGKRVAAGMPIGITPDTAARERFGSIRGRIESVSPFPVSIQEAARVVGNPLIAETLVGGGRLIQVEAVLELDPDGEGFRWSSSRGPDLTLSAGTTATGRAVVEQRRPIAFVLPFLKSAAGVD